jgi:hypothetical protein
MVFPRVLMAATASLVLAACNETVKPKTTDRAGARMNGAEVPQRPTARAPGSSLDQEQVPALRRARIEYVNPPAVASLS